jgi:iron complex outermembrane recepter protein
MHPAHAVNMFLLPAKAGCNTTNKILRIIRPALRPGCWKLLPALWVATLCSPALGNSSENLLDLSLEELLQIPVTSFRNSVMRSRDIKRSALIQQDSIVSEDISDFPDLNLAEALQRIPGIAISREGGEGRQITVRGLGANFSQVTMNGMDVMAQSETTLDSRNTISTSRAFDFNVFSADLFSRVNVKKSYSADQQEGGIAATLDLRTPKPFDFDGFKSNISFKLGDNQYTSDQKPQFSLLVSNTWDNLGALAALSYSKRDTLEQGYSTSRWRTRTTTNIGPDIDPITAAVLTGGLDGNPNTTADNLWFARLNRYSYWGNTQERLGFTSSLQFKPSDALAVNLNLFYGEFNNDKHEQHLATNGSASTALGRVNALEYIDNNGDLEVVYGEFSNVTLVSESRIDQQDTDFYNLVADAQWQPSEHILVTGLIGKSRSNLETPVSDKAYLIHTGSITTDFRRDRFYGTNTYDFDTNDPANWTLRELDFREDYKISELSKAKTAIKFDLDNKASLEIGLDYREFFRDSLGYLDNDYVSVQPTPRNNGVVNNILDFAAPSSSHKDIDWVIAQVRSTQQFYGLQGQLKNLQPEDSETFNITEQTRSGYVQYTWERALWGRPLQGNVGLRYFQTQVTTQGRLQAMTIKRSGEYDDFLPTANLVWNLSDQSLIRASASRNITRPDTERLSASAIIRNDPDGPSGLSIQAGNPELQPIAATSLDLALERYVNDIGHVSLSLFYKALDRFVVDETRLVAYGQTGYPLEFLGNGQDANTLYAYARPVNGDATHFEGMELSFQRDLDFLPAPFNHLGVITNYTLARGTTTYRNVQASLENQTKDFIGLSRNAANATLYYESEDWGARLSANYRDRYIWNVEGGLADEDERGYHASTRWDFSAFYKLSEQLKVTLEGVNLTNQREEQYTDSSDRLYGTTYSGRSYFVGVSFTF